MYRYGQMGQCMRDGGKTTKQMEREDLFMQMEISMMVSGKMIRLMAKVFIVT